ncbi:stalk domain-containing protein [Anaerotignum sp. MSJ-24]|uniref:stalk domain-containing protein n=1 Tax=Anaerotignum sp. MSJ-24 TaxID=2841521 RepID=UPI0020A09A4C|nr:stalk domain-containing protein [Anaerotignum sp. MSJ-24]
MKFKKLLSIFTAVCMLASIIPSTAFAAETNVVDSDDAEQEQQDEEQEEKEIKEEKKEQEKQEEEKEKDSEESEQEEEQEESEKEEEEELPFTEDELALLEEDPEDLSLDEQATYFMLVEYLDSIDGGIALYDGENANATKTVFKISTADQLVDLAGKVENATSYWGGLWKDASFEQVADINMKNIDWKGIGSFRGKYNGGGYSVKNIKIKANGTSAGFFSVAEGAVIENLAIVNFGVDTSADYVGAVVGYATDTVIRNCWTSGSVTAKENAGGIAGYMDESGSVSKCYSLCNVKSNNEAGGIVGNADGITITGAVVLGEKLEGSSVNRINGGNTAPDNCYAWSGMNTDGNIQGKDITYNSGGFSTEFSDIFEDDDAWNFTEDLPVLADGNDEPGSNFPTYLYTSDGDFKGSGTQSDPYLINNKYDLINLRNKVNGGSSEKDYYNGNKFTNKYFKQTADIDLEGEEWIPIANTTSVRNTNSEGKVYNKFCGTYDGNGHVIKNLKVSAKFIHSGLFGVIGSGGVIKNLGLENCDIESYDDAGTIAGAGMDVGSNVGTILNCYATGTVKGSEAGGLVGTGFKKIINCYTVCNVESIDTDKGHASGIAAIPAGRIEIKNCVALGQKLTGGQLDQVGSPRTTRILFYTSDDITDNNYAYAQMKVNGSDISTSSDFYGHNKDHGANISYSSGKGLDKQFSEIFKDIGGEKASDIWNFEDNMLPTLKNENVSTAKPLPSYMRSGSTTADFSGKGTQASPYLIQNRDDLIKLRDRVNSETGYAGNYFKQTTDIDLDGIEWIPIGTDDSAKTKFKGIYDGDGHEITNLNNSDGRYYGGLFGDITGTVKNLAVIDCNITTTIYYGGAIVANGGTIENCYSTGTVYAPNGSAGGISGNGSTIKNCYSTATVSGKTAAGIGANATEITGCVSFNDSITGTNASRIGSSNKLSGNYALNSVKVNGAVPDNNKSETKINGLDLKPANGSFYLYTGAEYAWNGWSRSIWIIPMTGGELPHFENSTRIVLDFNNQVNVRISFDESRQTYKYDGTRKEFVLRNLNVEGVDGVNVNVFYTANASGKMDRVEPINPGLYDVNVVSGGNADGSISAYFKTLTRALVIEKADNEITNFTFPESWVYGEAEKTPSADAKHGTVKFKYSQVGYPETDTQPTDAGYYTIKAYVEESDFYNYVEETKQFVIKDKNKIEVFDFPDEWYFGEDKKIPNGTAKFGLVNFKYSIDGGESWTTEQPKSAGSYLIKAYVDGSDNYSDAEETKNFTIKQAVNEITEFWEINDWTYGDSVIIIDTNKAKFGKPQLVFSADGENWTTEIPKNAGQYIAKAYVEETNDYSYAEKTQNFEVLKATPTVTELPVAEKVKRNRQLSTSAISGGEVTGVDTWFTDGVLSGTWSWKDGSEKMKSTGDFTRMAVFTPDSLNYNPVEAEINVHVYMPTTGGSSYTLPKVENDTTKPEENKKLILTVGSKNAIVFGESVVNDVAPVIVNERTMLPARFVAEALGAKVLWDSNTRTVSIIGENAIAITIGSDTAYVNGVAVKLDSPAFIADDRTYLPLRFIAENLGADVEWLADELKIVITKE